MPVWILVALAVVAALGTMFYYRVRLKALAAEHAQAKDLGDLYFQAIEALVLAVEGHTASRHGQLHRLRIYAEDIGHRMQLTEPEMQALRAAALFHDLGKLAVPEHVLTKPSSLGRAEIERMQAHAVAGGDILEQVAFPYPVASVVAAHHEKWDGTGYPTGLKGDEIALPARILAAIDCFDALLSDRYQRRAFSLDAALEHMRAESGTSFDPEVVDQILERYTVLEGQVRATEIRRTPLRNTSALLPKIAAARIEEQQFFQLARDLSQSLSLGETLSACARRMESLCPFDSLVIFLRADKVLTPEHVSGAFALELSSLAITRGAAGTGRAVEQRCGVLNSLTDVELALCPQASRAFPCLLSVPIEGATETIGAITLYARRHEAFTEDHLRIVATVAARAAAAMENARKYTQAEESATTDVLTGLANTRSLFLHLDGELARAKRNRDRVTVLVCDLDRFKQLNDLLGHMEGNRALRAIADALKRQCREYDFVARMGGDEFVVILPTYPAATIMKKIEQLQQSTTAAVAGTTGAVGVGMSIGHACFPEDGADAETLLAAADRRMYAMKQQRLANAADTTARELQRLSETLGPRQS
jgi:diguanylate cyclase (GGDEF)-like protein/putative nucleotidyltransferase with HDIG domain